MPANKHPKRRWWTVMLLYPDYMTEDFGADIFVDWALAPTAQEAVPIVQQKAAAAQSIGNPEELANSFRMIAVWPGRTKLALDATSDI
jgi:hypothetical protein